MLCFSSDIMISKAGADFILVKDAHASGTNLDIRQLPRCVELIRSGCGHPYTMAYGVDQGFDAAMFIGYHSAAGRNGSPLILFRKNHLKCA